MWVAKDVWAQPPGVADPVVRGVSFTIAPGEWLALTGPNGCGKSTLALVAAGLWPASRGGIEVGGAPLEPTAGNRARLRIAVVLQEPASQLFERRVADEIAFAARNLGMPEGRIATRVDEWTSRLGLERVLEQDSRALSAGWQQRVLIAAAMASDPALLVVDEGAAHMDAEARARILTEIRAATRAGVSVLWVTQDEGEAAAADRVLRLSALGRVVGAEEDEDNYGQGGRATSRTLGHPALDEWRPPNLPSATSSIKVTIERPVGRDGRLIRLPSRLEFTLGAGRPVALVGPNGAGKTVALEALAGLAPSPQVIIQEVSLPRYAPVFATQFPELQVFGASVEEELCFGPVARGLNPQSARETGLQLIIKLGLASGIMSRSTWSLSVGERRLVQIAAALMTPASRVLIDEPTCGLDQWKVSQVSHLLAQLGQIVPLVVATQDPRIPGLIGANTLKLGE